MTYPLEPGTVFVHNKNYWKITGAPYCVLGDNSREAEADFNNRYNSNYKGAWYMSYPVIKCNKNGLEFKSVNGVAVPAVKEIIDIVPVGTKASEVGLKPGKIKRRIKYLEGKINEYSVELEDLKTKI